MDVKIKNAPLQICLNIGDDFNIEDEEIDFGDLSEVTWNEMEIDTYDIQYIQMTEYKKLQKENEELKQGLRKHWKKVQKQNEELKDQLIALMEGLEIQHIDKFIRQGKVGDYRNLGKAHSEAVQEKIKELNELKAKKKKLSSEFWKDTAKLIEVYRKEGDNRATEGVVECRVLFDRLNSERSKEK